MKHKTKGFIAMILALCLMMSLGIGALADGSEDAQGDNPPLGGQPDGGDAPALDDPIAPGVGVQPDGETDPQENTYTLTVNATNGSANITCDGSPFTNGSKAEAGSTIVVTYSAGEGYSYQGVTATGINVNDENAVSFSGNKLSFTMPANNVTLTFNFFTTRTISISENIENGSVTSNVVSSAKWSPIYLTATPKEGYELTELKANDEPVKFVLQANGTYTGSFTMPDANVTVTATFTEIEEQTDQFPIDIVQSTGGSVNASHKAAAKDTEITLSYTANANYTFAGYNVQTLSGTTVTVEDGKFTMPGEGVTVRATFVYNQPPVTPT